MSPHRWVPLHRTAAKCTGLYHMGSFEARSARTGHTRLHGSLSGRSGVRSPVWPHRPGRRSTSVQSMPHDVSLLRIGKYALPRASKVGRPHCDRLVSRYVHTAVPSRTQPHKRIDGGHSDGGFALCRSDKRHPPLAGRAGTGPGDRAARSYAHNLTAAHAHKAHRRSAVPSRHQTLAQPICHRSTRRCAGPPQDHSHVDTLGSPKQWAQSAIDRGIVVASLPVAHGQMIAVGAPMTVCIAGATQHSSYRDSAKLHPGGEWFPGRQGTQTLQPASSTDDPSLAQEQRCPRPHPVLHGRGYPVTQEHFGNSEREHLRMLSPCPAQQVANHCLMILPESPAASAVAAGLPMWAPPAEQPPAWRSRH